MRTNRTLGLRTLLVLSLVLSANFVPSPVSGASKGAALDSVMIRDGDLPPGWSRDETTAISDDPIPLICGVKVPQTDDADVRGYVNDSVSYVITYAVRTKPGGAKEFIDALTSALTKKCPLVIESGLEDVKPLSGQYVRFGTKRFGQQSIALKTSGLALTGQVVAMRKADVLVLVTSTSFAKALPVVPVANVIAARLAKLP